MKTAYSFVVVRYVHDVLTQEFVNVGVVVFAPGLGYLDAKCAHTYGRISTFFGGVQGEHLKMLLRRIEATIGAAGEELSKGDLFNRETTSIVEHVARVLPRDDSSLQISAPGSGVSSNLRLELERLYQRFVEKYSQRTHPPSRTDEAVWGVFKRALEEKHVLNHLRPKVIVSPYYEHEFPVAWKNGKWNASEAISFDLVDGNEILDKANRWLGRAVNLNDSEEPFKLHLLLGAPRDSKLTARFLRAKSILDRMPCDHTFVEEASASQFAGQVEYELKTHQDDAE